MNNKYIKKQEYKYIVIPETRMVVCECTTEIDWWNLKNEVYKNIPYDWDKNQEKEFRGNYITFTVRTVAKAHPDDTFGETLGKRIAKSRANIKAYRKIKLCLNDMIKSLGEVWSIINDHRGDISELLLREYNHLLELTK